MLRTKAIEYKYDGNGYGLNPVEISIELGSDAGDNTHTKIVACCGAFTNAIDIEVNYDTGCIVIMASGNIERGVLRQIGEAIVSAIPEDRE